MRNREQIQKMQVVLNSCKLQEMVKTGQNIPADVELSTSIDTSLNTTVKSPKKGAK